MNSQASKLVERVESKTGKFQIHRSRRESTAKEHSFSGKKRPFHENGQSKWKYKMEAKLKSQVRSNEKRRGKAATKKTIPKSSTGRQSSKSPSLSSCLRVIIPKQTNTDSSESLLQDIEKIERKKREAARRRHSNRQITASAFSRNTRFYLWRKKDRKINGISPYVPRRVDFYALTPLPSKRGS